MGEKQLEISTKKFDKELQQEVSVTYIFPLDRYYYAGDPGHIWFKSVKSTFEVGFDSFGQQQAGPLLHIRTRPLGKEFPQGAAFGTVESDKWIGPLRLPLTAVLLEANTAVLANPQLVNSDCYKSWVLRIKPTKLEKEISSKDIISKGDFKSLKKYVISDLEKYEEPPIKVNLSEV
ncbi:MAG: glycine cleavage system protein H [Candidatus Hodarchaeota archaeon]